MMTSHNAFAHLWEEYQAQSAKSVLFHADTSLNTNEIVLSLGGIDAVLMHCLNSKEYCEKHISIARLMNLQHLLRLDTPRTAINMAIQQNSNVSSEFNEDTFASQEIIQKIPTLESQIDTMKSKEQDFARVDSLSLATTTTTATPKKISTTFTRVTKLRTDTDLTTIDRYNRKKIIYEVYPENNLYFKCLPPKLAKFMYYKAANKNCMLMCAILLFIFFILSYMVDFISDPDDVSCRTIGSIFWLVGWSFMFVGSIILLFSVNLDLASVILNSFDFWFKTFNNVIATVCLSIIRIHRHKLGNYGNINQTMYITISAIFESTPIFIIFLLDATLISHHIKTRRACTCFGALLILYTCTMDFFTLNENIDQFNWNPFTLFGKEISEYTNVNFKNLYVSSSTNLILFLMKPLFGVVARKIRKSICKRAKNDTKKNTSNIEKTLLPSSSVYKKPYFYWRHNSDCYDENDNYKTSAQIATEIVQPRA